MVGERKNELLNDISEGRNELPDNSLWHPAFAYCRLYNNHEGQWELHRDPMAERDFYDPNGACPLPAFAGPDGEAEIPDGGRLQFHADARLYDDDFDDSASMTSSNGSAEGLLNASFSQLPEDDMDDIVQHAIDTVLGVAHSEYMHNIGATAAVDDDQATAQNDENSIPPYEKMIQQQDSDHSAGVQALSQEGAESAEVCAP